MGSCPWVQCSLGIAKIQTQARSTQRYFTYGHPPNWVLFKPWDSQPKWKDRKDRNYSIQGMTCSDGKIERTNKFYETKRDVVVHYHGFHGRKFLGKSGALRACQSNEQWLCLFRALHLNSWYICHLYSYCLCSWHYGVQIQWQDKCASPF